MKNVIYALTMVLLFSFLAACEIADYPYFIRTGDDHGALWVAVSDKNQVVLINRIIDRIVGYYDVGINPSRTAVDRKGSCWVGSRNEDSVYYVTRRGQRVRYSGFSGDASGYVRGVALDQGGNVWITNTNRTIQRIDTNGNVSLAVSMPVTVTNMGYGAVVDSYNYLWISNGTSQVIRYDISQFDSDLIATNDSHFIIIPCSVYGITGDAGDNIWASGSGTLTKINSISCTITGTYASAGGSGGVTMDAFGNIWSANTGVVTRFNPVTLEITNHPINGVYSHGVGADDAGYIYSVNLTSGTVDKMEADSSRGALGSVVLTYNVGGQPYCYSDMTGFVYRKVTLRDLN